MDIITDKNKAFSEKMEESFTISTEKDRGVYVFLNSDATQELKNFTYHVHSLFDRCLPNDWIYDEIHTAFSNYYQYNSVDDFIFSPEPDIYYCDQNKWLQHPWASNFCDEAMEEFEPKTFYDIVTMAQCSARELIYREVATFIDGATC